MFNVSKFIFTKFDQFCYRTPNGTVMASVGYTSRFLGRTRARQTFSGVFAAIAALGSRKSSTPTNSHGCHLLPLGIVFSSFEHGVSCLNASKSISTKFDKSRPGPPPDPYFGLRVLYLTFPWPNACPAGIFRCFCCNRHFSSRTRTRHFLVLPWLVPL